MFNRLIYRSLCLLDRWQRFMRTRPTPLGRLLMGFTLAAGVFGADTRMNLLHQAFALGLGLLLFSSLTALLMERHLRGRFSLSRDLPRHATRGQPLRYRVSLCPQHARLLEGCFIEEQLPDPRPSLDQFRQGDAAGRADHGFDRLMGYPRWVRLRQANRWADWPQPLALQGPLEQGQLHLNLTLQPLRRGRLRFEGLLLSRPDPLGLFRCRLLLPAPASLLVLPQRYPLPALPLAGRRQLQPGGVSLASAVGDSHEFIGLRDYRPGDSPRDIHWASWARSGKPQVREYQDEYFNRQALVLDTCANVSPDQFEAAVSVAASLCAALRDGDSLLDLLFLVDQPEPITAGRGLAGSAQLLEALAAVQLKPNADIAELARYLLSQTRRFSALLLVLLTWDEARRQLAADLAARGLPLRLLLVSEDEDGIDTEAAGLRRIRPSRLREDLNGLADLERPI